MEILVKILVAILCALGVLAVILFLSRLDDRTNGVSGAIIVILLVFLGLTALFYAVLFK